MLTTSFSLEFVFVFFYLSCYGSYSKETVWKTHLENHCTPKTLRDSQVSVLGMMAAVLGKRSSGHCHCLDSVALITFNQVPSVPTKHHFSWCLGGASGGWQGDIRVPSKWTAQNVKNGLVENALFGVECCDPWSRGSIVPGAIVFVMFFAPLMRYIQISAIYEKNTVDELALQVLPKGSFFCSPADPLSLPWYLMTKVRLVARISHNTHTKTKLQKVMIGYVTCKSLKKITHSPPT